MPGADALRQQLAFKGFKLVAGRWKHPDIRELELVDASLDGADAARVQTLIRLIQEHPACAKYSPMASGQRSFSRLAG